MDAKQIIKQNRLACNMIADDFFLKRQYRLDELKFLSKYLRKGDKILDLGCGWGRLYQVFLGKTMYYTGVDHSSALLRIARKKFPGVKFLNAEMTKLPFKKNRFDKIFCILAFHNLLHKDMMLKALREMKRVVKKGGEIIMTNWNLLGEWRKQKVRSGIYVDIGDNNFMVPWKNNEGKILANRYYHAFSRKELRKLFEEVGLEVKRQYYERHGRRSNSKDGANIVTIAIFR